MGRMFLFYTILIVLCQPCCSPGAEDGCTPGELRTDSTPNSISIEWDLTGDGDHDATCNVRYRQRGSENWLESEPQNILIPDEMDAENGDFNFFYGMPTRYYAGLYWGFLWPFKMNSDIHTELAWSRDGFHFDRLPSRPKLIEQGPEGAWDDGMVFGSPFWVEVGDEWWIYYAGWDGPHGTKDRTPGMGLAKLRKEGFISMRGPANGGVLCTRRLVWPGGKLVVNADAHEGELRVRISDERRKVLPGFDYDDCVTFQGDDVAHEVSWQESSIDLLTEKVIRLEIFLKNADIYTFRATGDSK